ncbi:MAG: DUF177 domain-containing protein [Defluviitaleaceae bacterium]|nr:DUF177 domain-containing protein [Defluviitaleaceae bacterium]
MFDVRQISEGESVSVEGEVVIAVPVVFGLKEHATLSYQGHLTNMGESFSLEGRADTVLFAHCNRCLKTCATPVTFTFSEGFAEKGSVPSDGWDMEYENHTIHILPALERNLFNNIPMKFVCAEQCGGICPRCGRDQNLEKCGCEPELEGEFVKLFERFK